MTGERKSYNSQVTSGYTAQGHIQQAIEYYEQALTIRLDVADRHGEAQTGRELARLQDLYPFRLTTDANASPPMLYSPQ
jgi:hypothetical protein